MKWTSLFVTSSRYDLTATRTIAAIVLLQHGIMKISNFESMIEILGSNYGLPAPIAGAVILIEFLGPIALLLGAGGRLAAAAVAAVMLGAMTYHIPNGLMMNWFGDKAGEGYAFHLLYLAALLPLVLHGPGAFSVDRLIARRWSEASAPSTAPRSGSARPDAHGIAA